MKNSKRIIAVMACIVFLVSALVFPSSAEGAGAEGLYCDVYGHTYLVYGGTIDQGGPDSSRCYWNNWYQAVFECIYCGDGFMADIIDEQYHDYIMTAPGEMVCQLCGDTVSW